MKLNTNIKKYLQVKWRITPKFILTINIYESGYMLAFLKKILLLILVSILYHSLH